MKPLCRASEEEVGVYPRYFHVNLCDYCVHCMICDLSFFILESVSVESSHFLYSVSCKALSTESENLGIQQLLENLSVIQSVNVKVLVFQAKVTFFTLE
jgi:hypothetical protein